MKGFIEVYDVNGKSNMLISVAHIITISLDCYGRVYIETKNNDRKAYGVTVRESYDMVKQKIINASI